LKCWAKGWTKSYYFCEFKVDPQITTNFIKTCVFNTSACASRSNTTEGTAGDNKFEQLDSWVGTARDEDSRPCQTVK